MSHIPSNANSATQTWPKSTQSLTSSSRVKGSIQPTSKLRIGSLCTGYGGLDLAVEAHFNAETVWCAEFDKYASEVIKHHFNVPNYGNIKTINWASLPEIDILTAGYPCQPFSTAGERKGTDDERHLFPYIAEAISNLRPRWVVLENVRGHLNLGFKEVLAILTNLGYDTKWQIVRASDVGAPHQRARLFIVAYASGERLQRPWNKADDITYGIVTDTYSNARQELRRTNRGVLGKARKIIDEANWQKHWSGFEITEREVPPTLDSNNRLNSKFVEYMMGLPSGWVTDIGLSRTQELKMLGNGVVPQQAKYALELLTDVDN